MRSCTFVLLALSLTPLAATAQSTDPAPLAARSPQLSLTLDGSALPTLGVWKPVTGRLTLGLAVESDVMSSTVFPNGNRDQAMHHRYWRFAFGPAATFRLATVSRLSLVARGAATWGVHAFDLRDQLEPSSPLADKGFGLRGGIGLDWRVSDHWTLGATWLGKWTSAPGTINGVPRNAWGGPGLALSVRIHF